MLAISGMHKEETKLTIPNQVVREQLFAYILDTYHENDLTFDSYEKRKLASGLAYDGKWKPYFEYIAGCLHRYASQQDKQKGEYFVHGFTLAITAQNPFYRPVSEKDSQEGYVDLFLHAESPPDKSWDVPWEDITRNINLREKKKKLRLCWRREPVRRRWRGN